MRDFERKMGAFGFRQHEEFLTYYETLRSCGLTPQDVREFVLKKQELNQKEEELLRKKLEAWDKKMLRCPKCSTKMSLFSVNNLSGNQTGDNSLSMWLCPNKNCLHTIYNKEKIQEILERRI